MNSAVNQQATYSKSVTLYQSQKGCQYVLFFKPIFHQRKRREEGFCSLATEKWFVSANLSLFCVDKLPTLCVQISIGMTHCRNHFFKEHLVNNMWEKEKLREKKRERKKNLFVSRRWKESKKKDHSFYFWVYFHCKKWSKCPVYIYLKYSIVYVVVVYTCLINQIVPFQGSVHKRRSD